MPPAISGIMHVCEGLSTTLTDGAGSGAWSSSNTAVASVIPVAAGTAGTVTGGVVPGTATITYSPPTGCGTTATVTVNPLPGAVTGVPSVCVGSATILSDSPGGGAWSSSNTLAAAVNPTTGGGKRRCPRRYNDHVLPGYGLHGIGSSNGAAAAAGNHRAADGVRRPACNIA